jgi:hypothetical protein
VKEVIEGVDLRCCSGCVLCLREGVYVRKRLTEHVKVIVI